jgi:Inner membrane component of T3SS, cytoplasmic domain
MSELTLLILRLAFLAVLWVFVFAVVYALRSDLFGQKVRRQTADVVASNPFPTSPVTPAAPPVFSLPTEPITAQPVHSQPSPPTSGTPNIARRLVITSGPKEGLEIELPSEQLAIGRSSESGLVIRDDYTSTHHARLMLWNDGWVVQDLDSTNGTFLDGVRVTLPTPIPMNTPITIGTTSFELRR